jgi:hypothetical protein
MLRHSDAAVDASSLSGQLQSYSPALGCLPCLYACTTVLTLTCSDCCREVEEELEAVTKERDALLPSMEELKWQLRKAEKKVDGVADSRAELEQVGSCCWCRAQQECAVLG